MKRKKRYMAILLLLINIIMLTVAVIPHHHHTSGTICMKQDVSPDEEEPSAHHHPHNDLCCDDECMTKFCSPIPPSQTNCRPDYVLCSILYTEEILARLWQPRAKKAINKFIYQEALPDTKIYGKGTLRAPPSRFGA